jgi:ribonuclease P protein component
MPSVAGAHQLMRATQEEPPLGSASTDEPSHAIPLGQATAALLPLGGVLVGRLVNKADFERLLTTRARSRSAHFAVHHVAGVPSRSLPAHLKPVEAKLSTGGDQNGLQTVDNPTKGFWLGCVVPKRHARRSVTRSLLKRRMRQLFEAGASELPPGLWLMRLCQGFPVAQFRSAASQALSNTACAELAQLLNGLPRPAKAN